jgi:beta-phosphoglucomutase-like phosphatase (HAD superfamily)
MDIRACIFDLEGVMVDTANYHSLAWKKLAEKLGARYTEEDNECIVFEGAIAGIETTHRAGMKCVGVGYPDIMSIADLIIDGFKNFRPENIVFHRN